MYNIQVYYYYNFKYINTIERKFLKLVLKLMKEAKKEI